LVAVEMASRASKALLMVDSRADKDIADSLVFRRRAFSEFET